MSRTASDEPGGTPPILEPIPMLETLVRHQVEFVLIGGFSLAAHGFVRGTKDVDIVPLPSRANFERLMAALDELEAVQRGFEEFRPEEIPVQLGVDGLAEGRSFFLLTKFGWLDVLQFVEGASDYEELRTRTVERDLPGVSRPVWFAGRDDLISMKRAAGRPQDLVDLDRLEAGEGS